MLKSLVSEKGSVLDESIDRIVRQMETVMPGSDEYENLLAHLERLMRLRSDEPRDRVSKDTMAIVVGNLIGILIIVGYERAHVVASRGMNLLLKTKHQ